VKLAIGKDHDKVSPETETATFDLTCAD